MANSLLHQLYQTSVNNVNLKFKNITAICLTTDAWTSINNDSYVAVTAYYIDENTKMSTTLLRCQYFAARHTADQVSSFLKDLVNKWGLGPLVAK